MRKYWGGIRYFDLYGYVALAYDAGREVLPVSYTHLDVYKRQHLDDNRETIERLFEEREAVASRQPKACLLYTSRCV